LDSLTVYGTQLLWPLTEYPFGVSNLFIIDPFYTIPLLVGLIWASLPLKNRARAYKANAIGIAISSVYVCWTLGAKLVIDTKIEAALASRDITVGAYMSTPAPLNTLLWRAVAVSDTEYYEIYASIFDSPNDVSIDSYPSDTALLTDISDQWSVQRLQWFTKGLYAIKQYDNKVVLSDLRMGVECNYVFNFILADIENGQLSPLKRDDIERFTQRPDLSGLGRIWQRITDPSISLAPARNDSRCSTIPDLP
jgi:inner membrane protein